MKKSNSAFDLKTELKEEKEKSKRLTNEFHDLELKTAEKLKISNQEKRDVIKEKEELKLDLLKSNRKISSKTRQVTDLQEKIENVMEVLSQKRKESSDLSEEIESLKKQLRENSDPV